jgi:hypothetical protein
MVLLGDKTQVKAHFGPFGDSANLDEDRCRMNHRLSFRTHLMELLGDVGHVESYFGLLRNSFSVDVR